MNIKHYKAILLAQKQEIESIDQVAADSRGTVILDQQSVGRLSRMDALQGQAMNNAIAQRRHQAINRINAALKRMDEGEYGYCVGCGEEMATKRLDLDPAASQCTLCAC